MDKKTFFLVFIFMLVVALATVFILKPKTEYITLPESETAVEDTPVQIVNSLFKSKTNNPNKTFVLETDLLKITFDTKGASISSMMLKNHSDADGQPTDLIFKGEDEANAFLLYWGDDIENPILENFSYSIEGKKVIFKNTFNNNNGGEFTITKTYEFKDGEYLFVLDVDVDGDFLSDEYGYSIGYGPQVGPNFTEMKNNNYDYRRFYVGMEKKADKVKRTTVKLTNNYFTSTKVFNWISLTSKYFTVIATPAEKNMGYKYQAYRTTEGTIAQSDSFYISVPYYAAEEDNTFYFYCGPQLKSYLKSYYNGTDNAWGLKNLNLEDAMESGSVLGWLEVGLKWGLKVLYKIVGNYGIAIILLTIILKLILWPLQKTSSESTARMSAIAPEVEAIKQKYTDPQKQNLEVSKLYKEKGIKPLGGCLPLLIQFPILIAFYGLLNRHIELRGAMFIPGWIPDLSLPDMVATLSFRIPFLGNEIHILPIIYTASMIFSMKFTQANNQTTDSTQKSTMFMMTWGMPIMFFFVLYNAPAGLLLYWTTQNGLSILQQVYTNKKLASGKLTFNEPKKEKVEPEAVRKYQEKLKKLEELKAAAEKAKNNKK